MDRLLAEVNKRIEAAGLIISGRTERFVNVRTFRLYRTRGLVSSPDKTERRHNIYGEQHLFQLLAIKVLQSKWVPLEEIKARITNTDIEGLKRIVDGAIPTNPSLAKPAGPACCWVEVRLNEFAYALVEIEYMKSLSKSTARALADRLATGLIDLAEQTRVRNTGRS